MKHIAVVVVLAVLLLAGTALASDESGRGYISRWRGADEEKIKLWKQLFTAALEARRGGSYRQDSDSEFGINYDDEEQADEDEEEESDQRRGGGAVRRPSAGRPRPGGARPRPGATRPRPKPVTKPKPKPSKPVTKPKPKPGTKPTKPTKPGTKPKDPNKPKPKPKDPTKPKDKPNKPKDQQQGQQQGGDAGGPQGGGGGPQGGGGGQPEAPQLPEPQAQQQPEQQEQAQPEEPAEEEQEEEQEEQKNETEADTAEFEELADMLFDVLADTEGQESGKASYYSNSFNGRRTANGETFSNNADTCAHKTLPFGTRVTIRNVKNGRTTSCRVNDRGPYAAGRIIDLSAAVFSRLASLSEGVLSVTISY